jgi:hypothetical protein
MHTSSRAEILPLTVPPVNRIPHLPSAIPALSSQLLALHQPLRDNVHQGWRGQKLNAISHDCCNTNQCEGPDH